MDNSIFLSMAGLKENVLTHTQEIYNNPKDIFLCVDRDAAGENFVKLIRGIYKDSNMKYYVPPNGVKDWNDIYRKK
jgi:DNA primase